MTSRLILSSLGMFIILTSCKKEHFYTRSFVNNSDFNIEIVLHGTNRSVMGDTLAIQANSTKVIQDFHSQHRPKEGLQCALQQETILVFANGRPAEFAKSIFSDDNWEKDLVGNRSLDQDCFFEVTAEEVHLLPH